MKRELISAAVGDIDGRFVIEAENARPRKRPWIPFAAAAAACALIAVGSVFLAKGIVTKQMVKADLPKITIPNPASNIAGWGPHNTFNSFDIPSDQLPTEKSLSVYSAVKLIVDDDTAIRIARGMGVSDPEITVEQTFKKIVDDNVRISWSENRITAENLAVPTEPASEKLLDDEEYVRLAREYLLNTGLPVEKMLEAEPEITAEPNYCDESGRILFDQIHVCFRHQPLDGVGKINGSPCFIVVKLNNDGVPMGINGKLYDFTDPVVYPLMPVQEVMDMFGVDPRSVVISNGCPEEGGVATQVSIEYYLASEYANGGTDGQSYVRSWLFPVYVFRGERTLPEVGGTSPVVQFSTITRAISKEYLEFYTPAPIGDSGWIGLGSPVAPETEKKNVWKVREAEPDIDIARRVAALFGAEEADLEFDEDGNIIYMKNGMDIIFTHGRLIAFNDAAHELYSEQPFEDAEYVRLAKEFLNGTGLDLSDYSMDAPVVRKNGLTSRGEFEYIDVIFPHKAVDGVDGFRGADSSVMVEFTVDGRAAMVSAGLYDFYDPTEYPLISAAEVMRRYSADPDSVLIYTNRPENSGSLTGASLKWLLVPEYPVDLPLWQTYECNWLIPVYVFSGENDGEEFIVITRAISEEYLEITPDIQTGG